MQRRKKAAFGDEKSWSDSTRLEVERHLRRFHAQARRASQNPDAPNERWFAEHIQETRNERGIGYAKRYALSVGHHFRRCGAPPLSDGPLVRAVLRAPDGDVDPLAIDFDPEALPFSLGRAQIFADRAYAAGTYQHYTMAAKAWIARCKSAGLNPLEPPLEDVVQYFEDLAAAKAANTVRNHRNALSHYFTKNGVPNLARDPKVEQVVQGVQRTKIPYQIRPLTPEKRRLMLTKLEDEGIGVRDRVVILFTAFSKMSHERMTLIDAEHCSVRDDGIVIQSLGEQPPVHIGAHPELDLDPVYWLRRLLEIVPPSGPLFRPLESRRMRFGDRRLSLPKLIDCVSRAARLSGEPALNLKKRFQALFDAETEPFESAVIQAHRANRTRVASDRTEDGRMLKVQVRMKAQRAARGDMS